MIWIPVLSNNVLITTPAQTKAILSVIFYKACLLGAWKVPKRENHQNHWEVQCSVVIAIWLLSCLRCGRQHDDDATDSTRQQESRKNSFLTF